MKKLFQAALIALMLVPTIGAAQDYEAGLQASRAGDFETALKEWKPLAEQGHTEALYAVGRLYHLGKGVPQDDEEAVKWYKPAAEQGNSASQYMLGFLYATGQGVLEDDKEALKWYRLAAAQDVAVAQINLGIMYANGEGVLQDDETAYMWSHIAIANGFEEGASIRDDIGEHMTPADIAEAQRRAGVCIASNYQDCDKNTASAQKERTASAQQEEFDAQRQNDILVISDMVEAYYELNNHYPWVKEPQAETINIFISDNIPPNVPSSPPYQMLEAELQKTLGNKAVLPKDPEDDGLFYQYATNGQNYYVAAYLYHKKPYAWEQGRHVNKVEITNSPSLKTQSHKPDYLRHVLKFGPDDADLQAKLFQALQKHDFDNAALLLKNGANLSPTCGFNHRCQPLATAAKEGDLEIIKFLIDNGADLDGYNAYDDVALIYALENQQIEAAKLLIKSGASVNIPNAFGFSPFIGATALGGVELITLMIQRGAELDRNYLVYVGDAKPGDKSMRPLEFAIHHNQPEIVSLLLAAGANPSLHTNSGEPIEELGRISENKAIRQLF